MSIPVDKGGIVPARSPVSREEATLDAVERTRETVENLQLALLQARSIRVETAVDPRIKTEVRTGFEVEG